MNNSVFKSIVVVEKEVAIKWSNGEDSFIDLIRLRSSCPCAWCSGEKDVFGNIYSGEKKTLPSHAFSINKYEIVSRAKSIFNIFKFRKLFYIINLKSKVSIYKLNINMGGFFVSLLAFHRANSCGWIRGFNFFWYSGPSIPGISSILQV